MRDASEIKAGEAAFLKRGRAAVERAVLKPDAQALGRVEEIAAEMQRQRDRRRAERTIRRFDANDDGVLSMAEIENHQREVFALMDRNDDGVVAQDELPRRDRRDRDRRRHRD